MENQRVTFINGSGLTYQAAKIHIEDRGLQFGESVYEVIACYSGQFFRLANHLARLEISARCMGLTLPPTEEIITTLEKAKIAAQLGTGLVYLQLTAGELPRQHSPSVTVPPNFIVIAEASKVPDFSENLSTLTCMTTKDLRWSLCHIKATSLAGSTMAKKQSLAAGFGDAIFVRDGFLTEATSSNVFLVANGKLFTPPADNFILHGVTRQAAIEVASRLGIDSEEGHLPAERLLEADELFLTSTSTGLRPVLKVDSNAVGSGRVGPITKAVATALHELVTNECRMTANV